MTKDIGGNTISSNGKINKICEAVKEELQKINE